MASDVKISDALANALLAGGSLKSLLDTGFISIYAGTPVPASADLALSPATYTRLVKIAANTPIIAEGATGLTIGPSATGRAITRNGSDLPWVGLNKNVGLVASPGAGTATFFRWHPAADVDGGMGGSGVGSATDYRIQGTVGAGGCDLNLTSALITDNGTATTGISTFEIRVP